MTITFPLRLIILHLSQIFLTEGLTFIIYTSQKIFKPKGLFRSPCNTALGQIVWRHFDRDLVSREYSDKVHTKLPGNVGCDQVSVGQLDLKHCVWQCLPDDTLNLDHIFF